MQVNDTSGTAILLKRVLHKKTIKMRARPGMSDSRLQMAQSMLSETYYPVHTIAL